MTTSYAYDNSYEPAAPIAHIGLSPSGEAVARQELTALVDSGADATMIPVNILTTAGARYVAQRQMRGVVGESVKVNLYLTAVHIGNHKTAVHCVNQKGKYHKQKPLNPSPCPQPV